MRDIKVFIALFFIISLSGTEMSCQVTKRPIQNDQSIDIATIVYEYKMAVIQAKIDGQETFSTFIEDLRQKYEISEQEYIFRQLLKEVSDSPLDGQANKQIYNIFREKPSFYSILFAGKHGIVVDELNALSKSRLYSLSKVESYYSLEWAELLVLSRNGDVKAFETVVRIFEEESELTFKYGKLIKHIAYINTDNAYMIILSLLNRGDTVSYTEGGNPIETITVDLALTYLPKLFIEIIENFPEDLYYPENISVLRDYFRNKQGLEIFEDTISDF